MQPPKTHFLTFSSQITHSALTLGIWVLDLWARRPQVPEHFYFDFILKSLAFIRPIIVQIPFEIDSLGTYFNF